MVSLLPPGVPLQILADETMGRRKGEKIKTKGCFAMPCDHRAKRSSIAAACAAI